MRCSLVRRSVGCFDLDIGIPSFRLMGSLGHRHCKSLDLLLENRVLHGTES